jgi:hypothetical protein
VPTKVWAVIFLHSVFNFVFQDDVFPTKITSQPTYSKNIRMFASLLGEVLIHVKMSLHTASHIVIRLFHWQSTLVMEAAFTRTISIFIKNKMIHHVSEANTFLLWVKPQILKHNFPKI